MPGPPTRRAVIRAALGAYVLALGLTVALTEPWESQAPARVIDRRAADIAPSARPASIGGTDAAAGGTPTPRPTSTGAADSAAGRSAQPPVASGPGSSRKRTPRRLPRAAASPDPLAPALPVPPAPVARLSVTLGRCCSESRAGAPVDAIVLHATESPDRLRSADLIDLASYFRRAGLATQVADDAQGTSIRMVGDDRLAYHATYWNDVSVGIEQVGYSVFTRSEWLARPKQLETTARWVAYWARRYRIPIRRCAVTGLRYDAKGRVSAGTMVRRGVCSHAQLDPRNRDDPGRGYPWDVVLARARALAGRARAGG